MIIAVVAEIILIIGFNYQLEGSESLHFGHYVWLIMIVVIFFWAWRKKRRENRRYGWLKKRLAKMTGDQVSMVLAGSLLITFSLLLFSCLKVLSEPIGGRDIAVIAITAISGLGFAGGSLFFEEVGRFVKSWREKIRKLLARTPFHKKSPGSVTRAA